MTIPQTDRQTDRPTNRPTDQQTFGLIEATCRRLKMTTQSWKLRHTTNASLTVFSGPKQDVTFHFMITCKNFCNYLHTWNSFLHCILDTIIASTEFLEMVICKVQNIFGPLLHWSEKSFYDLILMALFVDKDRKKSRFLSKFWKRGQTHSLSSGYRSFNSYVCLSVSRFVFLAVGPPKITKKIIKLYKTVRNIPKH